MAKKELLLKGHTVEELQAMPQEDVLKLLTARARDLDVCRMPRDGRFE